MILREQLAHLFKTRQSVRGYLPQAVETDKIARCIEAARIAPSACNAQPWKFIVVDNPELKNQIADLTTTKLVPMNHFTKQAPVMVVVVMESPNFSSFMGQIIRNKTFTLIDVGMATLQFCLQATAEGLGSCILGWFNEKKVKKLLNIPRNKRAILVLTLGYPLDETIREKRRKETKEIFSFNGY